MDRPTTTAPTLVASRYELEVPIGRGGAGEVWRGFDRLLERPVAIKRMFVPTQLPEAEQRNARVRVLREARAAARISSPTATRVYDVVEERGTAYIVLELVPAPDLAAVVAERGPLPAAQVAAIGLDVLRALEAAHALGIVHRDVKPSNVLVVPGEGAKLTDFGTAAMADDPRITATGLVLGSPAFMSPEQALDGEVGPPSDLWSLGATLYFAVEGVLPFVRETALGTLDAVVREPHPVPLLAGPLTPLLDALLAKAPAQRPTAQEIRQVLERVAAGPARRVPAAPGVIDLRDDGAAWRSASRRGDDAAVQGREPDTEAEADATVDADAWHPSTTGLVERDRPGIVAGLGAAGALLLAAVLAGIALTREGPAPTAGGETPVAAASEVTGAIGAVGAGSAAGAVTGTPAGTAGTAAGVAASPNAATDPTDATDATADAPPGPPTSAPAAPGATTQDAGSPDAADAAEAAPGGESSTGSAGADEGSDADGGEAGEAEAEAQSGAFDAAGVPEDWVAYQPDDAPYEVAHPEGWTIERLDATRTDIEDPASSAYLRLDWTDTPQPDALEDWEAYEQTFRGRHEGYERVRLERTTFKGEDAALWEYRYTSGGTVLHAYNLNVSGERYGYALNFQTREDEWAGLAPLFDAFAASYRIVR